MRITAYKTDVITAGALPLTAVLDKALPALAEGSVVAVSSKVVALCEGRAVPLGSVDKDELIARHAAYYLPRTQGNYKVSFTITNHTLVPTAGIDESNGNGNYVLWPADPQASANMIRRYLADRFQLEHVGVVLTDSAIRPLRWGVSAIAIASSGFEPLYNAIGQPDLFGRPLQFTTESIQDGLAAAAALVMGEGAQQTPIAVLEDMPFVTFTDHDPTPEELQSLIINPADDIYAPFLNAVQWRRGQGNGSS